MAKLCHDYAFMLKRNKETIQLLVQSNSEAHELISVHNDAHFWQTVAPVNQAIYEKYALQVSTLCCLKREYLQDGHMITIYATQYHGGDLPDNLRWMDIEELRLSEESPITIEEAKQWLTMLRSEDRRPQWYGFDWYEKITEIAAKHNAIAEQVRSWERSTVWRLVSTSDKSYLKAVPPMFAHELSLSQWLAEQFPEPTATPIESSQDNMLLFADYGNESLMERQDLQSWREAIQIYAALQIKLVPYRATLESLGVPVRSMDWIAERIEVFLMEDSNLIRGTMPLTQEEIMQLQAYIPELIEATIVLKDSSIPLTLEHGDLWAGQVILQDGRYLITDWSDSAISFPFFSLAFFLAEIANDLSEIPEAAPSLTDAYLKLWSDYASLTELKNLMPYVRRLSPLYSALRYHYDILPHMNQQWEMINMVAYNLRLLLAAL